MKLPKSPQPHKDKETCYMCVCSYTRLINDTDEENNQQLFSSNWILKKIDDVCQSWLINRKPHSVFNKLVQRNKENCKCSILILVVERKRNKGCISKFIWMCKNTLWLLKYLYGSIRPLRMKDPRTTSHLAPRWLCFLRRQT